MKTVMWMTLVMVILFTIDILNLDGFVKWFALIYFAIGAVMFVKEFRNARR